jgi:hypothetical protein
VAEVFQHGCGIEQHQRIVIHREDDEWAFPSIERLRIRLFLNMVGADRRHRKPKLGRGAFAFPALEDELAAGLLDHSMNHRQSKAGALADTLGGEEGLRARVSSIPDLLSVTDRQTYFRPSGSARSRWSPPSR